MDISISMEATDLSPNRLEAAKSAAVRFVEGLPEEMRVGLAFFAGNSYVAAPPTLEHRQLISLLKGLTKDDLRPGTAIGEGIVTGMETLQPPGSLKPKSGKASGGIVILVTDGENNLGISPQDASDKAVKNHVVVHTIGIGQEEGAYIRGGTYTHLDESALEDIANQTGGLYFRARRAQDFGAIYKQITTKTVTMETKRITLTWLPELLATLLILTALTWAIRFRRV